MAEIGMMAYGVIAQMHEEGMTAEQIAHRFGVSVHQIERIIAEIEEMEEMEE